MAASPFRADARDIEIHFQFPKARPYRLSDNIPIILEVEIIRGSYALEDAYFEFDGEYWQPVRAPLVRGRAELTLKPWAVPQVEKLHCPKISLFTSSGKKLKSVTPHLTMYDFCKDLLDIQEDHNFLLFGVAGATKSSFINSCYSVICPQIMSQIAHSGGSASRVTTEFKSYRMISILKSGSQPAKKLADTGIRLWDTWGLEREKFTVEQFRRFASGEIASGTKMTALDAELTGSIYGLQPESETASKPTQMHTVLFFIPASSFSSSDIGAEATMTLPYVEEATRLGIPAFIILAQADNQWPDYRKNPEQPPAALPSYIQRASRYYNVPELQVVPLMNYMSEPEKSFSLDKVIFTVLSRAISCASGRVVHKEMEEWLFS